ncbi:MAG: DUF4160 domain-containing protein [Caldilineaceae bacterium]|nr:DUF4160 domain-containing protein [Caldilineaceae bacterium]
MIVLFYSNEHEPVHVHGKYQNYESRADLILVEGQIVEIRYSTVRGRRPLPSAKMRDFRALVDSHAEEIIAKWIEYFVLHKSITPEQITQRIR